MAPRILSCLLAAAASVTAQETCNYTDVNALISQDLKAFFYPWCQTKSEEEFPDQVRRAGSYKLECLDPPNGAPTGIGYGTLDTSGNRFSKTSNVPKNVVYEAIAPDPTSDATPTSFEINGEKLSPFEDPCNARNEVLTFMTGVLWGGATCDLADVTKDIVDFMNGIWGRSSCTFTTDLPFQVYECESGRESARYEALGWYGVQNLEEFWSEHTIYDRAFRVGCVHPDPCNALKRVKEATSRVTNPDFIGNSSSNCDVCSEYCNDSCSYYCSSAFSMRASLVTMLSILGTIALMAHN